jgi:hypothetical protein
MMPSVLRYRRRHVLCFVVVGAKRLKMKRNHPAIKFLSLERGSNVAFTLDIPTRIEAS